MATIEITSANFDEKVLSSEKPVVLDFWATWCGPCSMMSPVVEAASEKHPELAFGTVDTDAQPELSRRFGVTAIPTIVVMKGGRAVKGSQGYMPEADFEAFLERALQ